MQRKDMIAFRLDNKEGREFRRLAAKRGGVSAILRRFVRLFLRRHEKKENEQ